MRATNVVALNLYTLAIFCLGRNDGTLKAIHSFVQDFCSSAEPPQRRGSKVPCCEPFMIGEFLAFLLRLGCRRYLGIEHCPWIASKAQKAFRSRRTNAGWLTTALNAFRFASWFCSHPKVRLRAALVHSANGYNS